MSLSHKDIYLSYIDCVLTMYYKNSYIEILNKVEHWSKVDGYNIKKPFMSNVRLLSFYSQKDKQKQRTKKGDTTKLLYYGLKYLVDKNIIHQNMNIVVEVDPSVNNNLVKKVYKSIGFSVLAHELDINNGFTLMYSHMSDLYKKCLSLRPNQNSLYVDNQFHSNI